LCGKIILHIIAERLTKLNQFIMEENNKLIAEFMDLKSTGLSIYKPSEYKYHTSWDWLMPVIHKILQDNDGTEFFNFSANISQALFNNNINNAYKSVVEFIKDYNQNN
jgi:hypothetical protein